MESWPADSRTKAPGKTREDWSSGYPVLEYGTLGSITLSDSGGRWKWSSAFTNSTVKGIRATGDFLQVFPATRSPPLHVPSVTTFRRAEHAAAFLRTRLPDIDIPSTLIKEELTQDAQISRKLEEFDPQMGARLATVRSGDTSTSPSSCVFLAFPMGELNRELNLSPFTVDEQGKVVFRPTSWASHTFDTPLLQIVSSDSVVDAEPRDQYLAARTFSSAIILEAKPEHDVSSKNTPGLRLTEKANIVAPDVGNRPVVDIKLFHLAPRVGVVVNDVGGVYRCDIHNERVKTQSVYSSNASSDGEAGDGFWRLALVQSNHQCLLASNTYTRLLDFRTKDAALDLFSVQNGMLTAIEDVHENHINRLVSTSEIIWVDERFPGKPLLGYKHRRQYDRSLNIQTVGLTRKSAQTFLTSRKNGLVTIYDVSGSNDGLLHVKTAPYALPTWKDCDGKNEGQIVIRYPLGSRRNKLGLLRLSDRGSICAMDLHIVANVPTSELDPLAIDWSGDVKALGKRAAELRPDIGPLGAREIRRVDLRAAYEQLLASQTNGVEWGNEKDAEAIYENIERIPNFWQESDGEVESMLTTYDVAFRSGRKPARSSRADFLTQSAINSTRGYRALTQGRLSTAKLSKDAPWSWDILPILKQDIDIPEDSAITADSFRQYDLRYDHPCAAILRKELQAREQLALDLALSGHIFSPRTFSNALCQKTDKIESVARSAEAMSLNDEPPRVQFGYLQPIPKQDDDGDPIESLSEGLTLPLGVRLLLREWEIGADPHLYKYDDPYGESVDESKSTIGMATSFTTTTPTTVNLRAPPPIVASKIAHPKDVMPVSLSQGAMPRHDPTASSRVAETSTQPVPGPHGGRLNVSRRVKKRLGGF